MIDPWNKGLTKNTDPRLLTLSKKIKRQFKDGRVVWNKGKKGLIPWNKGLTKETDERVRKNVENFGGSKYGWKKGCVPWNKGLTKQTDLRVLRCVQKHVQTLKCPEIKKKMSIDNSHVITEKTRKKMKKSQEKRWQLISCERKREIRKKIAFGKRRYWKSLSPSEKEKKIKKLRATKHPTTPEKFLIRLIDLHELPFMYFGNRPYPGLEGKHPDFVSTDGSKRIIEYDEYFWHQDKERDLLRNNFYKSKGFDIICLNEQDLKLGEEYVLNKIETWRY